MEMIRGIIVPQKNKASYLIIHQHNTSDKLICQCMHVLYFSPMYRNWNLHSWEFPSSVSVSCIGYLEGIRRTPQGMASGRSDKVDYREAQLQENHTLADLTYTQPTRQHSNELRRI